MFLVNCQIQNVFRTKKSLFLQMDNAFNPIQSKNHAAKKGKMAGRYQFDTHPTGIGLN